MFVACLAFISLVAANNCQNTAFFPNSFSVGQSFPMTGYSNQQYTSGTSIQIVSQCAFSFYPNYYLSTQPTQLYAVGNFGYYPIQIQTYGSSYIISVSPYSWSEFSAVYVYHAYYGYNLGSFALPTGVRVVAPNAGGVMASCAVSNSCGSLPSNPSGYRTGSGATPFVPASAIGMLKMSIMMMLASLFAVLLF